MKKLFTIFLCGSLVVLSMSAQGLSEPQPGLRAGESENSNETPAKLRVSGYIQGQYQWGQQDASLSVGAENENPDKSFSRIGVRRGRIRFTYDATPLMQGVFQIDVTEANGGTVGFKDVYLNIKDPWINTLQLRAGIFNRPFGYELSYSSSRRESPERSTIVRTLFPDERDVGAMVILQPSEGSR